MPNPMASRMTGVSSLGQRRLHRGYFTSPSVSAVGWAEPAKPNTPRTTRPRGAAAWAEPAKRKRLNQPGDVWKQNDEKRRRGLLGFPGSAQPTRIGSHGKADVKWRTEGLMVLLRGAR